METYDAEQNSSYRSYASPHRICSADGQCLYCYGKQQHADNKAAYKTYSPQAIFPAFLTFHFSKAKGKSRFKQSGYNQDYPIYTQ